MLPAAGGALSRRSSGVRLEDLVAVPIDVGKRSAMASVLDFTGSTLAQPFEFSLDRVGVGRFVAQVRGAVPETVLMVRVGLEAAGHYHLPLIGGVLPEEWELRILNPGHVAQQRRVNGQRGVKTDRIDLKAIGDLLLAGRGDRPPVQSDPVSALCGWAAHRRRRSLARRQVIQQLTSQVDRCFPGLDRALSSVVLTRSGRHVISEFPDPVHVVRLGAIRLRAHAARRGVRMTRPLAERIVEAAKDSLPVPGAEVARTLLGRDLTLLKEIEGQIAEADEAITELLEHTPFAVLGSVPGWGVARISNYGAAVGEPGRWPSHRQLYRASGLTPRVYESAGKRRDGHISREGSVALRTALIDLGIGLWHSETNSQIRAAQLRARGMPGGIVMTAMAHRANRIAFAMVRDQSSWEAGRWTT